MIRWATASNSAKPTPAITGLSAHPASARRAILKAEGEKIMKISGSNGYYCGCNDNF
jgi:hypothetical protein